MKLLNHLQIPFTPSEDNIKIECLWCGGDGLSIDTESPHVFQCFKCHQSGNALTLIRHFYDILPPLRKAEAEQLCQMKQGIAPLTLRSVGLRHTEGVYWLPVHNQKKALIALHKYVPQTNIWYSSPKPTSLSIIGLQNLTTSDTVWVGEGHWDFLTLLPLMTDDIDLLGTCGSYFPTNLLSVLGNKHVVLLYDNDTAGTEGVQHVARHLKSNSVAIRSLSKLDWSKITVPAHTAIPDKFDVRDLYNAYQKA